MNIDDISNKISETALAKKYNLGSKKVKIGILLGTPIIFLGAGWALFSGGGVSCSGREAKNNVLLVAKDHGLLAGYIMGSKSPDDMCAANEECSNQKKLSDNYKSEVESLIQQCKSIPESYRFEGDAGCPNIDVIERNYKNLQIFNEVQVKTGLYNSDGFYTGDGMVTSQRKLFVKDKVVPIAQKWLEAQEIYSGLHLKIPKDAWAEASKKISYSLENIITKYIDPGTGTVLCSAKLSAEVPDYSGYSKNIMYSVEENSDGKIYVSIRY